MGFRGIQALIEAEEARPKGFEAAMLPEAEREQLCRALLSEFGVTRVLNRDGELIHGCVLPFGQHKDQSRNPTASLNYKKLVYKCVGSCDAGGGLLWFIGLLRGSSGTEARKWLDQQTGTGGEEQSLSSLLAYFDAVYNKERAVPEPIPQMSPSVLAPWLVIHPYLTEVRGIPEPNIIKHQVGYGTIGIRMGARPSDVVKSERIVIPHFWRGSLVGWQSRRLLEDGTAKYVNSPQFPKDQTIYNYDPATSPVVVESPMSVVSKTHLGPIEGVFGASITERQVKLLSLHPKVTIFFDNDEAGWKATAHLAAGLENFSLVHVVENPWAADPADLPDDVYTALVESAVPYYLWSPPKELLRWPPAREEV